MILKLSLLTLGLTANLYASELTSEKQIQVMNKCKAQAAMLAHKVDENSKEHANYTDFKSSKIIRVVGGYSVVSQFKMHWDIEAYDASDFTVVMTGTIGGACELDSMRRN